MNRDTCPPGRVPTVSHWQFKECVTTWPTVVDHYIGELIQFLPGWMTRLSLPRMFERCHCYQRMPPLFRLLCNLNNRSVHPRVGGDEKDILRFDMIATEYCLSRGEIALNFRLSYSF